MVSILVNLADDSLMMSSANVCRSVVVCFHKASGSSVASFLDFQGDEDLSASFQVMSSCALKKSAKSNALILASYAIRLVFFFYLRPLISRRALMRS